MEIILKIPLSINIPISKILGLTGVPTSRKIKSLGSRIKGVFVGTGMTVEYALKGLISAPMSYFYGSEATKEAETTHLIIL